MIWDNWIVISKKSWTLTLYHIQKITDVSSVHRHDTDRKRLIRDMGMVWRQTEATLLTFKSPHVQSLELKENGGRGEWQVRGNRARSFAMPLIPATGRQRQVDLWFLASESYMVKPRITWWDPVSEKKKKASKNKTMFDKQVLHN